MVLNSPSVIRPEARASWSCASLEAKEGTGVGGKCTGWPVDAGVAGGGGSDAKGVAGGGASDSMGGGREDYCRRRIQHHAVAADLDLLGGGTSWRRWKLGYGVEDVKGPLRWGLAVGVASRDVRIDGRGILLANRNHRSQEIALRNHFGDDVLQSEWGCGEGGEGVNMV